MKLFQKSDGTTTLVNELDRLAGRIAQTENDTGQHTEDIGAILEKMDSESTSRQSDIAHLRGRVEGCEAQVGALVHEMGILMVAVNDMLARVAKVTKRVRR